MGLLDNLASAYTNQRASTLLRDQLLGSGNGLGNSMTSYEMGQLIDQLQLARNGARTGLGSLDFGSFGSGLSLDAATRAGNNWVSDFVNRNGLGGHFDSTGGIRVPKQPTAEGRNLEDPNVAAQYQEEMQRYSQMLQLLSAVQAMLHDTRKAIINNCRA